MTRNVCVRYCLFFLTIMSVACCGMFSSNNNMQAGMLRSLITYIKAENPQQHKIATNLRQIQGCKKLEFVSQEVIEIQDDDGDTLLHSLAKLGNPELFRVGLTLNINPNVLNRVRDTVRDVLIRHQLLAEINTHINLSKNYQKCIDLYEHFYNK